MLQTPRRQGEKTKAVCVQWNQDQVPTTCKEQLSVVQANLIYKKKTDVFYFQNEEMPDAAVQTSESKCNETNILVSFDELGESSLLLRTMDGWMNAWME